MKRLLVLVGAVALGLWVSAGTAEAQAPPEGAAITAVFSGGTLTVTGTAATTENILVDRTAPGTIRVNGGAVVVSGGPATVANTDLIVVRGLGGRDVVDIDDAAGDLPPTELYGGGGDDNIQASDNVDLIVGGPGEDFLYADSGEDTLDAGTGDDIGIWVGSDDDDSYDGGPGTDHLISGGSNQADEFELARIAGGRVSLVINDVPTLTLDGFETTEISGRAMGDALEVHPLAATDLREITWVGGEGPNSPDGESDDLRLLGGEAADRFRLATSTATLAPPPAPTTTVRLPVASLDSALDDVLVRLNGGADTFNGAGFTTGLTDTVLVGGPGNDTITGTGTADQFVLAAADGSDVLDGRAGVDHYGSDGVPANETISFTASGIRTLVKRNAATSDLRRIEDLDVAGQTGADTVTVHDLSGTPVTDIHVDLRSVGPDGVADTVAVDGTSAGDTLAVVDGPSGTASVTGAVVPVSIEGLDEATVRDRIRLNGLGGGDVLTGGAVVVPVTLAGGGGPDELSGGTRDDRLLGGEGADRLVWAGGLSDTIDGGPGADRLRVDGTGSGEEFAVVRNGSRVRVARDANDLNVGTVERLDLRVVSGIDEVVVGDLTGTGVGRVEVLLQSTFAGTTPDAALDVITYTGRPGVDDLTVGPDGTGVRVAGGATLLVLRNADPTDRLALKGAGNADEIDATALPAGRMLLTFLGGPGNDVLRGSPGDDTFDGGAGTDTVVGGPGLDSAANAEIVSGVP